MNSDINHWDVRGSMPPAMRPGRSYLARENITAHVVCVSARRAIELVEAKHAGIDIHSVVHRGAIDVIDDRESEAA